MLRRIVIICAMAVAGAAPAAASAMNVKQHVATGTMPRVAISTGKPSWRHVAVSVDPRVARPDVRTRVSAQADPRVARPDVRQRVAVSADPRVARPGPRVA